MELLLSTDKSVTEIAYEVGFGGHSYYDRIFRRFNGLSPQEFRQNANHHQPAVRSSQALFAGKSM
jgi:transcriptional regulator GlxA family with amidase domain